MTRLTTVFVLIHPTPSNHKTLRLRANTQSFLYLLHFLFNAAHGVVALLTPRQFDIGQVKLHHILQIIFDTVILQFL